ncbi:MAG: PQQ-binding-like beta-propeller repeat protein [Gemmataceae bacterium]
MVRRERMGLAVVLTLALAAAARADDWPQWLGPQRDGVWRETDILDQFPKDGPTVRWRSPIGAGYAGPAVAGGKVYVTDRVLAEGAKNHAEPFPQRPRKGIAGSERVLCLNEADGKILWKHEYDCPYTVSYPLGPRCTPVVHDGKVYTLGTEGHLVCLDITTGKPVWSHELKKVYRVQAPLWGFSAHPLIDGKKLICVVGGEDTTAVAFDKDTGKELWRALSSTQPGYCPPVIVEAGGTRQLIVWTGEAVNGLDPETGKVYWSEHVPTYQGMSIATPRKFGDLLFVTAYPDTAVMLRLDATKPAATVAWKGDKKSAFYSVFSTPQGDAGHIYGVHNGGRLACIKADTGERVWESVQAHGKTPLPSAEVFLVKNGDRYFLANEKGDLILAKLSPKGYEEIGRAHLLDPTSAGFGRDVLWSHPAFANRSAYMRNDKELICVSLAARP